MHRTAGRVRIVCMLQAAGGVTVAAGTTTTSPRTMHSGWLLHAIVLLQSGMCVRLHPVCGSGRCPITPPKLTLNPPPPACLPDMKPCGTASACVRHGLGWC